MKQKFVFYTVVIIFISLIGSSVVRANNFKTLAPENYFRIGTSKQEVKNSNISKKEYMNVLYRIDEIYAPIVEKRGKKLIVGEKWDTDTVNAYSHGIEDYWYVVVYGGLARHEDMTIDGLALAACHEVGHFLGGRPKLKYGPWNVVSEGQADYFASLKCLRKYFSNENNVEVVRGMKINRTVEKNCNEVFSDQDESAVCKRSAQAGLVLSKVLRFITTGSSSRMQEISFETPSDLIVEETITETYPSVQCRLDTFFAGALCHVDAYEDVSDRDVNTGVCSRAFGDIKGVRPLCWFFPEMS